MISDLGLHIMVCQFRQQLWFDTLMYKFPNMGIMESCVFTMWEMLSLAQHARRGRKGKGGGYALKCWHSHNSTNYSSNGLVLLIV